MTDKLFEICETKREDVARKKMSVSFAEMDRRTEEASPPRRFANALRKKVDANKTALICEIKKASPSAGLIRPDFDPVTLAEAYEKGGATCLSVLTEEHYFKGCNTYLKEAREACTLPVLRKDFIVDLWQIAESRAIGADCVLLILAALDDSQLQEFHAATLSYGMNVLLEIHDRIELERALRLTPGLIGINNRNLKTLQIDLGVTENLIKHVPEGREVICESGIKTINDISRMKESGAHRFLIGESLMKQADIVSATKALCA